MDKFKDLGRIFSMAQAKFIRIDDDSGHENVRTFANSFPYEGLKVGEVVDVDCEDGQIRDYYVDKMEWDFTHFGDTLVITIKPVKPPPKLQIVYDDKGQIMRFIKG